MFLGGLERSKMSFFLGPKPTQDPMNIVFEKKFLGKNFFRDPRDPRPKKFSGRAGGGPKGGQNRSVGVSNPSKTVRHPHGTW